MSIIRQDPTTKEWVIPAIERAKRPHNFQKPILEKKMPEFEPKCPFCPSNEALTPPESMRLPKPRPLPDTVVSQPWAKK